MINNSGHVYPTWAATRILKLSLVCALAGAASGTAVAQIYPDKPVRLVLPGAPGSGADTVTRLLAEGLSARWKQPVLVEHKPGANGVIAARSVLSSPSDGYTFLVGLVSYTVIPFLQKDVPFDLMRDFRPVSLLATSPVALGISSTMRATSMPELLSECRASAVPCSIGYGEGLTQLSGVLLAQQTGLTLTQVPYKGTAPMIVDLAGGHVQIAFTTPAGWAAQVASGKARVLAIAGSQVSSILPKVPTAAQAGLKDLSIESWFGLLAPAQVSDAMVRKVQADIHAVLSQPELRAKLVALDIYPVGSTSLEFGNLLQKELKKWQEVTRKAGIQPE